MTKLRLTPLYWKSNIIRWDWLHCIENQTSDVEIDSSGERADRSNMRNQVGFNCPGFQFLRRILNEHNDKSMAVTKKYLLFEKLDKGKVLCKSRPALCRLEECQHLRFSKLLSRLNFWPEAYIVTMAPWSIMMVVKPWVWKLLGRGLQGCSNRGQVPVYHFISMSISLRVMQAFLTE